MAKKVMIGMSGGVDSSVAGKLLLDDGYEVVGVTLKLHSEEDAEDHTLTRTCCSLTDVEDARSVAYKLGFEHFVFNFKEKFQDKVIDQFIDSYLNGNTPNPCIECNKHIKFDKMLQRARELDYDMIATGHYAIRDYDEQTGRYLLKRACDTTKDQTYVLYTLTQDQLAHTLFPLGKYTKKEIRDIAEKNNLINSRKPDSQDICFVPDGDYASFIRKNTSKTIEEGNFVDTDGHILGKHSGIINYTIGQRKGLGIALGKPQFVISKDIDTNNVTLGDEQELYTKSLLAKDVNLISVEKIDKPIRVTAKTRYSQREEPATALINGDGLLEVIFDQPQRAISSGQAVVLYQGEVVVGGGTII